MTNPVKIKEKKKNEEEKNKMLEKAEKMSIKFK